ncbi:MAG TPA: response regulator, partial [Actinobacteria bacterium]|nr:response regulator [Actinomycetes bacterium]HEX21596.1 response regulator [Actinomycetota bacterium]
MSLKVLIVDDEAPARSEMRYLLNKIKNVEVLGEAITAGEALKLLKAVKYDIVFLDINMPGMSGIEMAQEIKKMTHQPAIIFTTAYSQFAVDAFELDAVDYLVKPISKKRLLAAISRINETQV